MDLWKTLKNSLKQKFAVKKEACGWATWPNIRVSNKIWLMIVILVNFAVVKADKQVFMGLEDTEKRTKIMKEMVDEYAIDGKVALEYREEKGTYTVASKDIKNREDTIWLPPRTIMSVYDEIPFKATLINALSRIPDTNNFQPSPNNPQDFYSSTVLLAIQLLMNINVNRSTLDSKFPEYKNVPLYIENCKVCHDYVWTLPSYKDMDHPNQWEQEDHDFYNKISFTRLGFRDIRLFHKKLIDALHAENTPESLFVAKEIVFDMKQYLWAYNIVNTRCFMLKLENYKKLYGESYGSILNMAINQKLVPQQNNALLPIMDYLNMIVPQKQDFEELSTEEVKKQYLRRFYLIVRDQKLYLQVQRDFKQGQEYGFAYTTDLVCNSLISTYGFAVKDGVGQIMTLSLVNEIPAKNYELCAVLNCVWNAKNLPKLKRMNYQFSFLDDSKEEESLLMLYRIAKYAIDSNITSKKDIEALGRSLRFKIDKYGYISIENEIGAIGRAIDMLEQYLSKKDLDIPEDLDQLPYRQRISYYCAIDQRNVILWHITNLHGRLQLLLKKSIEEES